MLPSAFCSSWYRANDCNGVDGLLVGASSWSRPNFRTLFTLLFSPITSYLAAVPGFQFGSCSILREPSQRRMKPGFSGSSFDYDRDDCRGSLCAFFHRHLKAGIRIIAKEGREGWAGSGVRDTGRSSTSSIYQTPELGRCKWREWPFWLGLVCQFFSFPPGAFFLVQRLPIKLISNFQAAGAGKRYQADFRHQGHSSGTLATGNFLFSGWR